MPDELILVRCQATPKLPTPNIRQISRKKIVTRSHLIRCFSSLMSITAIGNRMSKRLRMFSVF